MNIQKANTNERGWFVISGDNVIYESNGHLNWHPFYFPIVTPKIAELLVARLSKEWGYCLYFEGQEIVYIAGGQDSSFQYERRYRLQQNGTYFFDQLYAFEKSEGSEEWGATSV